jgi:hypothetical protein
LNTEDFTRTAEAIVVSISSVLPFTPLISKRTFLPMFLIRFGDSPSIRMLSTWSEQVLAPVSMRAENGMPVLTSVNVAVAPMMCLVELDTDSSSDA